MENPLPIVAFVFLHLGAKAREIIEDYQPRPHLLKIGSDCGLRGSIPRGFRSLPLVNFDSLCAVVVDSVEFVSNDLGSIRFGRDVCKYLWTVFSSLGLRARGALLRLCGRTHISSKRQEHVL